MWRRTANEKPFNGETVECRYGDAAEIHQRRYHRYRDHDEWYVMPTGYRDILKVPTYWRAMERPGHEETIGCQCKHMRTLLKRAADLLYDGTDDDVETKNVDLAEEIYQFLVEAI